MSEEKESLLSALLRAQRCLMYGGLGEARGGHGCGEERGSTRSVGNSCGLTVTTGTRDKGWGSGRELACSCTESDGLTLRPSLSCTQTLRNVCLCS